VLETKKGMVTFYDKMKGYGLISLEGGQEVFIHMTKLKNVGLEELHEGDKVEVSLGNDRRSGRLAVETISVK
jgi:CspA family cold shock protein